ncbi:MAG: ABC transporter ATP-binding protein [Deltaproteobacteria bacterium]|nr:ABC transporter ATP-binding protein [Deltaproteobacteria bacterium]
MTVSALEVASLSRSYGGKRVVNNLDLLVEPGDIYGFLGPNGAGKTTTMRMILGLIRRDEGTVRIFGEDDPVKARRNLGGIVESPRFYPYLTGRDNLRIFAAYTPGVTEGRIDELLTLVRLRDRAKDLVKTYSMGMRQRLGVAQALLGDPKMLMLDEPVNGLDPAGMKEVRELIRDLRDERGLTVFVSSHLLSDVELLCDRIGIIQDGTKIIEGRTEDLVEAGESLEDAFLRLTRPGSGEQIR